METVYERKVYNYLFSSLAITRQAFGFTLYTHYLSRIEKYISKYYPSVNKFCNYSFSAVVSKLLAMVFESPLTVLKTRVEYVNSKSVLEEFKQLLKSPMREYTRGLGSSIVREMFYTLFHYNTYRFLKDDVAKNRIKSDSTFIPAFIAGVVAITASHPF